MDLEELIKRIRKTELLSVNLSHQKLAGTFKSSFKGRGLSINSVRKYEYGDDVRDINWHVTARLRDSYINTFTEDKERLFWIMVDVSASQHFGTCRKTKIEQAIELAATIAYGGLSSGDRVGLILFNDKIEKIIEPGRGMSSFWRIGKDLVQIKAQGRTNLKAAISFFNRLSQKSSVVFLLSDFQCSDYASDLRVLSQKHELFAIRIFDKLETALPDLGWVRLQNPETQTREWHNSSDRKNRSTLERKLADYEHYLNSAISGTRASVLSIDTEKNPAGELLKFMIAGR